MLAVQYWKASVVIFSSRSSQRVPYAEVRELTCSMTNYYSFRCLMLSIFYVTCNQIIFMQICKILPIAGGLSITVSNDNMDVSVSLSVCLSIYLSVCMYVCCLSVCYFRSHRSYLSKIQKYKNDVQAIPWRKSNCKKRTFIEFDILTQRRYCESYSTWHWPTFWRYKDLKYLWNNEK